jgi:DNA-binding response OmpR family regulator
VSEATTGPTLLVVDDNEDNRFTLVRRLKRLGYDAVTTATNGKEALARLEERPFDLVLLDVMMPEMNGYDVLERLRADARLRDVPVIMISAVDQVESVVRCIELGAADYLPKPFDPVILRARVAACLERKQWRNQEVQYLHAVARVTAAAAALEAETFDPGSLAEVTARPDTLGQLARVFTRMAAEVVAREAQLKREIQTLKIEIDEAQKARQVSEITDTDYFHALRQKARALRQRAAP